MAKEHKYKDKDNYKDKDKDKDTKRITETLTVCLHFRNPDDSPSTVQYRLDSLLSLQSNTAQYSQVSPSTVYCRPVQSNTAQYSIIPPSTI